MNAIRSKAARLQLITDLISRKPIHTQDELRNLLLDAGFAVTQATLSRDLEEIGAIKIDLDGKSTYAFADSHGVNALPDANASARLTKVAAEVLTSVAAAQNLVVAHTRPGAAHYLASAIDRDTWPEVVGSVAGDDTVMIVAVDAAAAIRVADFLNSLVVNRIQRRGSVAHSE